MNLGVKCDDTYNKCIKKAQDLSRPVKVSKNKDHLEKQISSRELFYFQTAPADVQIPCKIFDTTSLLHGEYRIGYILLRFI